MTRINKIRLTNFSWPKNRRIDDLLLDFHGGQNTEMRLDNGGGKSVLERLIYQAVWPGQPINKIPVSDYLSEKPATVAVEWLLDAGKNESADILTSGVVLVRQGSSEDERAGINYFAFVSHDAEHLSIHDLPNIRSAEQGRKVIISAFQESRDAYVSLAQKYSEIHYYSRRDDGEYRKMLGAFGISAENWSQLIRQLISGENPFDEVLDKTKTSDALLDKYLIPMINDHLDKVTDSRNSIRENTDHIVKESAEQKHALSLRDGLNAYLGESDIITQQMHSIQTAVRHRDACLSAVSGFMAVSDQLISQCSSSLQAYEQQRNNLQLKEENIGREKASAEWYEKKDAYDNAFSLASEIHEKLSDAEQKVKDLEYRQNLAEACQLFNEIETLQSEIDAWNQKMKETAESDQARQVQILQYSLKKAYEKDLQQLDELINKTEESRKQTAEKVNELEAAASACSKERVEKQGLRAQLTIKAQSFEKEEKELFERLDLGFVPGRSFTGELIKEDVKEADQILDARKKKAETTLKQLQEEKERIVSRMPACADEIQDQISRGAQLLQQKQQLLEQLDHFNQLLNQLQQFFRKYDISEKLLFDETREDTVENLLREYREQKENAQYDLRVVMNLITAVHKGSAYLPPLTSQLLESHGISYRSGQQFLKERSDGKELAEKMPLLPYSIILDPKDFEKLQELKEQDLFIDRAVPVFLYSDLSKEEDVNRKGLVFTAGSQKYFGKSEKALFEAKSEVSFINVQQQKAEQLNVRIEDLNQCISECEKCLSDLEGFTLDASEKDSLEEQIQAVNDQISDGEKKLEELKKEQKALPEELVKVNDAQTVQNDLLKEADSGISAFHEYVKNDHAYAQMTQQLYQTQNSLKQLEKRAADLDDQMQREKRNSESLHERIRDMRADRQHRQEAAAPFENAAETKILQGTIDSLRKSYQIASEALGRDNREYQQRIDEAERDKAEKQSQLNQLGIDEEQYRSHYFEGTERTELKRQLANEQAVREKYNQDFNNANAEAARAQAKLETASEVLREHGLEQPLAKEEISGSFEIRLKRIAEEKQKLISQVQQVQTRMSEAQRAQDRIKDSDIPQSDSIAEIEMQEDLSKQAGALIHDFRESEKDTVSAIRECAHMLSVQKKKYTAQDPYFNRVFDIDLSNEVGQQFTAKKADNLLAAYGIKIETLKKKLDQLNADLLSFDKDQSELYRQIFARTRRLSQALSSISSRSRVRVEGSTTPKRLLDIRQPEIDDQAESRVNAYLKQSLARLSQIIDAENGDYEKQYNALLGSRKLLNVYLNTEQIRIRVYKFEKVSANSGLMDWDRACRSNSGGEHSLSCFIVIASLMSWIRNDQSEFEDAGGVRHYETIICDNPFASVSSEHLVRPLIQIVNTLNIQLLTFTHITSASIANSFDVVIQLRNVSTGSNVTKLRVEDESVSEEALNMESASLFRKNVQESLF